jgi:CRP-like cAMP-binding protein
LESNVKTRKFLRGHFVVQNGDIYKYVSFVSSGYLKSFYIDNDGQEYVVMLFQFRETYPRIEQ